MGNELVSVDDLQTEEPLVTPEAHYNLANTIVALIKQRVIGNTPRGASVSSQVVEKVGGRSRRQQYRALVTKTQLGELEIEEEVRMFPTTVVDSIPADFVSGNLQVCKLALKTGPVKRQDLGTREHELDMIIFQDGSWAMHSNTDEYQVFSDQFWKGQHPSVRPSPDRVAPNHTISRMVEYQELLSGEGVLGSWFNKALTPFTLPHSSTSVRLPLDTAPKDR